MTEPRRLPAIAPYPLPTSADLSSPRASFVLDKNRTALLVHDMQAYFCAPYPAEAAPLAPVVAHVAALLNGARAAGVPVFYTAQEVQQDPRDRGLQANLWGVGMQDADLHRPILPALAPVSGDHVLVKHRYSAFQRSNLAALLRARGRDQIIICGVYAHIGVMLTAAEAFMQDVEPFIVADAVADFSREKHDLALGWVAATCGVPVMTDTVLGAFA